MVTYQRPDAKGKKIITAVSGSELRLGAQARHSCLSGLGGLAHCTCARRKQGRKDLLVERASTHAAILDLGKLWQNSEEEDQVIEYY